MLTYEYMKEVVVYTGFLFIIMLDVWGIGFWTVKLVKWIWSKIRKPKDAPAEETESEAATEE